MHDFTRILVAAALVMAAIPSASRAYYIEVRGSNSEAGVDRPITYDDADPSTPEDIDVLYRVNDLTFPDGVPGVAEAIEAGFATWQSEACANLSFTAGPPSDSMNRAHWIDDMGEIYILVFFSDDPTHWTASPNSVGNFFWAHDGTGRARVEAASRRAVAAILRFDRGAVDDVARVVDAEEAHQEEPLKVI